MQASSAQQLCHDSKCLLPRLGSGSFFYMVPLSRKRLPVPRSSLAKESKQDERTRKFFEALRNKERNRMLRLKEISEKAKRQHELDSVQVREWAKFLSRFLGKAKGTYWDPEPGPDLMFSDFTKLLKDKKVQFMDYANAGEDVAVILPHRARDLQASLATPTDGKANDNKLVFRRYNIRQMPADGWNDIWDQLHQQLIHVNVINTKTIFSDIEPTLVIFVVWSMRVLLASVIFNWLRKKLYPWYKLRDPNDRPKIKRLKLGRDGDYLGSLGQSRARFITAEESTGVTFDDFAGQEYVKRELKEVVKILKGAKEYMGLGVYCPKGVLLYGPPGTGKTLLARAIAGEAGVPFFSASGSEFVEMFVGVAAARVRDLFTRARQFAPSIIFIDEIDAIGAKRGGPDVGGGGVEREQGLIQILTELDGFQTSNSQVLVVGATNRLDMLDPALLRKGRFDKVVSVGLPTEEGRLEILRVHARNKDWRSELEKESFLKSIASSTIDYSGAELQNVLNEASILAVRKDKPFIEMEELEEAIQRQEGQFKTGEEDDVFVPDESRIRVAYREAAIAVLECYYPNRHRPFLNTTIRYYDTIPNINYAKRRGRVYAKKKDMVNSIVRACAPRVIEEQIFGEENVSWISGTSLEEAGSTADYLILQTGMTALGQLYYQTEQDLVTHLGPKVQALRDEYLRFALEKCASVLKEYRSAVETITEFLLEKTDIDADEIWHIFNSAPRIPQLEVAPVDEYGALLYAGRWGIYGVSLPGRVTFNPGFSGFVTFGAPRPMRTRVINEEVWRMMDAKRIERMQRYTKLKEDAEAASPEVVSAQQIL
ncbi:hypothetical protein L7F22_069333 [Adiantum nelumboides]|nr:hypothetical protein [Adiantum nelumboides]MCO5615045.1 hypothetical protein [Adiantum nelumboides]